MKTLRSLGFLAGVLLVSSQAVFAAQEASFSTETIRSCDYWTRMTSGYQSGYVCSMMPMTIRVPEAFSLDTTIQGMSARIDALEQKVQELEKIVQALQNK